MDGLNIMVVKSTRKNRDHRLILLNLMIFLRKSGVKTSSNLISNVPSSSKKCSSSRNILSILLLLLLHDGYERIFLPC